MSTNNVLNTPKFSSEREEAEWWDANPDFLLNELLQAKAEGRLGHGTLAKQIAERQSKPEKQAAVSTTMRIDNGDLKLARELAKKKGLPYQTYLKMLIHQVLLKEAVEAFVPAQAKKSAITKKRKAA